MAARQFEARRTAESSIRIQCIMSRVGVVTSPIVLPRAGLLGVNRGSKIDHESDSFVASVLARHEFNERKRRQQASQGSMARDERTRRFNVDFGVMCRGAPPPAAQRRRRLSG